ncbi:MAG TPA: Uma2 family endonuclease [Phototrophicaceae bacterium]|nr:Uma2 family endonuclease [Phototrophicaceae bacterium]
MAVQKTDISLEAFEEFLKLPENEDRLFELIDGEIVEKVPTEEHGLVQMNLGSHLWNFNRDHKLGGRVTSEPRHRMPQDKRNSRLPDVAFTSKERALPLVTDGAVPQMPDLVVEIKSPNDSLKQMREKAAYYLANGARLVWLVLPSKRLVEIYRANGDMDVLRETETLDGEDVLPGFKLPVADIFAEG